MITVLVLFINSIRVVFGYSEIVKDYNALFLLGMSELLIIIILLIIFAMYNALKEYRSM